MRVQGTGADAGLDRSPCSRQVRQGLSSMQPGRRVSQRHAPVYRVARWVSSGPGRDDDRTRSDGRGSRLRSRSSLSCRSAAGGSVGALRASPTECDTTPHTRAQRVMCVDGRVRRCRAQIGGRRYRHARPTEDPGTQTYTHTERPVHALATAHSQRCHTHTHTHITGAPMSHMCIVR